MKNKLKIIFLTLGCFILVGCPAGYYHEYKYIGKKHLGTNREFTILTFNEKNNVEIKCGFYYQFIGENERGLVTQIRIKEDENFDLLKTKVKVKSHNLGELKQRKIIDYPFLDSLPTLLFIKQIKIKQKNKILKLIGNDTITIEFENGMKYQFVNILAPNKFGVIF